MRFFVFYFLPREKRILERENRYAASLPTFSLDGFLKGDFSAGLSAFASDRLPLRDAFCSTATLCELALGKRERGDVLYAGGGRLIPLPKKAKYGFTVILKTLMTLMKNLNLATLKVMKNLNLWKMLMMSS